MSPLQPDPRTCALDDRLAGRVVAPNAPDWDRARRAFNLALDQRPELVAFPADADDVAGILRFASAQGLRVAAQRTGHNAAPLGSLEQTLLLNPAALDTIELDIETRHARVGAGVVWQDLLPSASQLGLAALHGTAPNVGIVGYSLGGGIGWYARKYGIAANAIVAFELVTPDGELRTVDATRERELFWALRGGGGSFGVVTSVEFAVLPIAELYAGALFFPLARASDVLHAWREWTAGLPDEVTSVARLLQLPPLPEIPAPLRGGAFAVVEAACLTGAHDGAALLAPLRALRPSLDTFAAVPPIALATLHMDPPEPVPYASQHLLLAALPAQAIDDLLTAAGPGSGSRLLSVELRHLGGALARRAPHHGALAAVEAPFMELAVGMAGSREQATATQLHLDVVGEALAPYDGGARCLEFLEARCDPRAFFDDLTLARLRRVRDRYDPDGLMRANHALAA
jgi:FAD/FMN-containing dehydrogenase